MKDILKGNFKPKRPVNVKTNQPESLETQFEQAALKRLGGSIAFVSKKKVLWDMKAGAGTTTNKKK